MKYKIGCYFFTNLDRVMCYNIIFICRPLPANPKMIYSIPN